MQLVIFGATGDLATKKIFPALAELDRASQLSNLSVIIGFSRREWDDAAFRNFLRERSPALPASFLEKVSYHQGTFTDQAAFTKLAARITEPTLFYFAIGHSDFSATLTNLRAALGDGYRDHHIILEKPFGTVGQSAEELWKEVTTLFAPEQIFLVDHYTAKKAVRALPHIQPSADLSRIRVLLIESNTAEGRAAFYDQTGALRDVGQNHVLTVLARVCMPDDPQQFIASLTPIKSMRGQYEGYKEHVHNPSSTTETYFKVTARSNVPEWKNVKFILEAGKGFAKDAARVAVEVQQGSAIKEYGIQPDTSLVLGADGYDGYAELFRRMLAGDMSLFISIDEVRAAWKLIDAVRNDWLNNAVPLVTYPQGAYNQTL